MRGTFFLLATLFIGCVDRASALSQCSLREEEFYQDPAMHTMPFDLGYGPQEFRAYKQPDVSTFYRERPGDRRAKTPAFNGFAFKIVNMSPNRVKYFWDPGHGPGSPMSSIGPWDSAGTASFPTHKFYLTPFDDETKIIARFVCTPPQAVYYYDPITVEGDEEATQANLDALSQHDFDRYQAHSDSREFNKQYYEFTGREYLSTFPRNTAIHKIWPADYFGQEHWVTSEEVHFVDLPEESELKLPSTVGRDRRLKDGERFLEKYRSPEPYMNMTMKVLSWSTTAGDNREEARHDIRETRTSLNTWVYREKDLIIDAIYRRAADLLRIDEALLRPRSAGEVPEMKNTRGLAEALQLVHYEVGQEYTAHHDFGYAPFDRKDQPARFATLLLYLNEGMVGGETQFPRWANAETRAGLDVEPKIGKAVLFYSQLPDGNMDDLSQHAARPVKIGEKWLMNLWVWDPEYQ
ncbi:hypothetical protein THAOC_15991 [Thalassiosira oceanica]|uniref:Fe2OG dioxygenase domain-containing protein n=1 Tax=Thalassiosira oceanica TaxID=159749 RepID=K0SQM8_THAOC|nr:hypothetical protein THAOC_15991 [Thalassiosira oceanica]|eukprot:EJK63351.1 hypothetical protein THAOC_15991 [Thalassiosira oceanica]